MSDKKDHAPDSPSQGSNVLPFKKRDTAENALPGSSDREHDHSLAMNKKLKLDELQRKAYFRVLHAFVAESSEISSPRITIIDELKEELSIDYNTHIAFEDKIIADPLVQQWRKKKVAAAEEGKITAEQGSPSNKDDVSEKPVAACDTILVSVDPESLVGRLVRVRMPDEENFEEFLIKEYDAEHEMHRFEAVDPDAMERDAMLSWMDIREVPPEHIIWGDGDMPTF